MSDLEDAYIACSRLIASFAVLADAHRNDEVGELFTEDCTFSRPGVHLACRAELVAFFSARPRDQIVRHCCALPFIELTGQGEARGVTYLTYLRADVAYEGPAKLDGVAACAEYHDRFVSTPGGWRIASRSAIPVMVAN